MVKTYNAPLREAPRVHPERGDAREIPHRPGISRDGRPAYWRMPSRLGALRRCIRACGAVLVACTIACSANVPAAGARTTGAASVAAVDVSWLSVTNLHLRVGSLGILVDGYITRLPSSTFVASDLLRTRLSSRPDSAMVARVLSAIGGPGAVNVVLSGHSHFDHSFDTAVWSKLTRARIYGPRSTCF